MTIRILNDETINKIAAGEVIEDPSSVVKELVDNALDAGASQIEVVVVKGGFQEICVIDNGEGMSKEDAILCVQRHATKKIQEAEDLLKIETMGFRGEALAAIASISKLQVLTSQEQLGHLLQFHATKLLSVNVKARSKGSSFKVQKLFFNTPARKKFQKSVSYSSSKILQLMTTMILSHPNCGFKVRVDSRMQFFHTPQKEFMTTLKSAINTVLKGDFYNTMKSICIKNKGFSLEGFIGSSLQAKSSRRGQYLFINYRPVSCKEIADTISSSFSTRIGSQEHIPFVLFLHMPKELVDVNVHPKKIHVRFCDAPFVQNFVSSAIKKFLEKQETFRSTLNFAPNDSFFSHELESQAQAFSFDNFVIPKSSITQDCQIKAFDDLSDHVLALFKNFFILKDCLTHSDKLLIVDLNRAQKTLTLSYLQESLKAQKPKLSMQTLIDSPTIQVCAPTFSIISNHLEYYERLGISLREFGPDTFIVDALYDGYAIDRVQELVVAISESLKKNRGLRLEQYIILSSQYAVSHSRAYTHQEAIEITKKVLLKKRLLDHKGVECFLFFDQKAFDFCATLTQEV